MIIFKTEEFDVHIKPEKVSFISKEPFVQNYVVCLSTGVGIPCTGTPTYDEAKQALLDSGHHVEFQTPTGLPTCVNRDFVFLATVDVAKSTIVYPGGARCVVAECLEKVKETFECE